MNVNNGYLLHTNEALSQTQTDGQSGLSNEEAQARLAKNGKNKLKDKKKKTLLQIFLSHLNDALIFVLLAAVAVTFFMQEYIDGVIILAVVFLNAILGVVQELKADNAIEALQQLATPKALVKRNGQILEISSEEIVVGDIVMLDAGRFVPADLRLIESANLKIDEAALTGESIAVEKNAESVLTDENSALGDRVNMAFMSTLVTYGRGAGLVVATSNATEVGKIATIISNEGQVKTPLEQKLGDLGKTLGKVAIAICIVMFAIGYFQGRDLTDMFMTAVSLAVASIPEGLAAIVAIVLSIGVTKMAKQNAIIKKLPAVETLGSVNIICSDKTGTLTQNKMTVTQLYSFTDGTIDIVKNNTQISADGQLLSKAMVLNSDATLENGKSTGDPTEIALLQLADDLNLDRRQLAEEYPRIDELAFDSIRKMMSTLHQHENEYVIFAKGAIDHVVPRCKYVLEAGEIIPLTLTLEHVIYMASDAMSDAALRTLAVAFKKARPGIKHDEFEDDLVLIGVVGMMDPPREEVKISIAEAKKAGISTVMITGDHKNTALAIAQQLGIATDGQQAISGVEINQMQESTFESTVSNYSVFARVSPEHKVKIVKALKGKGNIVSMTGDGVNDAPSLNAADIGVAMGITGTDVAKNASDMILADDNFATIVSAIEEGRNIYNNIKKSVIFLLSSNVGEVIAMLIAIVAGMPIPLLATQLLWINLVTDSLPAIALGMSPGSKDVMLDPPRKQEEGFFAKGAVGTVVIGGISIGLVTILSYYLGFVEYGYSPFDSNVPEEILGYARTIAFMTIIACQLFYALTFVHPKKTIFTAGLGKQVYLLGAIVLGFVLQLLVLHIPFLANAFKLQPLHFQSWVEIIGLGLIPLLINEFLKLFRK